MAHMTSIKTRQQYLEELDKFLDFNGFAKKPGLTENAVSYTKTISIGANSRQIIYQNGQAYEMRSPEQSHELSIRSDGPCEDIETGEQFDIIIYELDGEEIYSISSAYQRFPGEFISDYQYVLGSVLR